MSKTIIVGGGINGLLLGALLTRNGDDVLLFEKNERIGGRAALLERDGFTLDNGIHCVRFGPESALAKIMHELGFELKFTRPGISHVIDYDGEIKVFPTSPSEIFQSRMFSFFEKIRMFSFLMKIKRGAYDRIDDISLEEWFTANTISGGIKKYFELLSASVMVCPFYHKTSAREMFRTLKKIIQSGHSAEYPVGGWKSIHDSLTRTINDRGSIITGKKIDSIIINDGTAEGVIAGKKKYYADRIVLNIPVQELFMVVDPKKLNRKYVDLCNSIIPTSGISIDVALRKPVSDYNGWLYSVSPTAFGMITSNLEPGIVPPNMQLLTMFYPVSLEDISSGLMAKKRKDELWGVIYKYFPEIEKYIYFKREFALRMVDGVQVNKDQTADKRPGTIVPGVANLFLVGDSVSAPGAGGDVGNESVLIAYKELTGKVI